MARMASPDARTPSGQLREDAEERDRRTGHPTGAGWLSVLTCGVRTFARQWGYLGAGTTVGHSALVGRQREFAEAAALLDAESPGALLVTGAAGVGKTRLLDELTTRAADKGWVVRRAIGAPSTAELSLAPFAHLEPTDVPVAQDPGERLARLAAALRASTSPGTLLVVVDDAHHLDPASAALVHQLVVQDRARVALAARDGYAIPEAILELVSRNAAATLTVAPLDRRAADVLLTEILGGPATPQLANFDLGARAGQPAVHARDQYERPGARRIRA